MGAAGRRPGDGTALGTVVVEATLGTAAVAVKAAVAVEAALAVAVTPVAAGRSERSLKFLVSRVRGGAQGLGQHLTLVDPYLNTDAAVGGRSFSKTIVDVRTQGLQGMVPS